MPNHLVEVITAAMQNIKANKIVDLDLESLENAITGHFIICHGSSNTHVVSIAQAVEKEVKESLGEITFRKEGYQNGEWILLDYSSVVVHVFQEKTRDYYNIEELWGDAKTTLIEEN
ncbi:MAG: ribosome-associated protein [Saprospiraceae bacterium]